MSFPDSVRIVEVSPRDGLQNEMLQVPVEVKIELIERLVGSGERSIEAAAFVSPKRIPQMADSAEVMSRIRRVRDVNYSALVPNLRGFEAALSAGATEIAVFAAASEAFSQRNIQCSIEDSIHRFLPVLQAARQAGIRVRGYVSCALGCPYEGLISPERVSEVAARLFQLGCYEISLGDTIGVGTPNRTKELVRVVAQRVPVTQLAGHFHDTYGQALVNVYASLECGVKVFDASVSGLGGCPYAPGASGNLATEDLVYMLDGMGIKTGINLESLMAAGAFICAHLGRQSNSKVALAVGPHLPNADYSRSENVL